MQITIFLCAGPDFNCFLSLSFIYKWFAVSTFFFCWVCFMSTNFDSFQSTIFIILCVVSTVVDGTHNAGVLFLHWSYTSFWFCYYYERISQKYNSKIYRFIIMEHSNIKKYIFIIIHLLIKSPQRHSITGNRTETSIEREEAGQDRSHRPSIMKKIL